MGLLARASSDRGSLSLEHDQAAFIAARANERIRAEDSRAWLEPEKQLLLVL